LLLAPPLAFVLVLVGVLVHRARRALVAAGLATLAVSILLTLVLLDIPRSHRYTPNPPSLYQKET
jgi:hypothetical protein